MKLGLQAKDRILAALRLLAIVIAVVISGLIAVSGQAQLTKADVDGKTAASGVKSDQPDSRAKPSTTKMKVVFDATSPGVVYVESNGERIRIDTASKTVDQDLGEQKDTGSPIAVGSNATTAKTAATPAKDPDSSKYDFDKGEEPYDFRIVNIPTPKNVPKHSFNLVFTHRFTQPIHPLSTSGKSLFGLDSFGIASFGLYYGITDKLYVSAYRSPICQKGLCRTVEVGLGYNWLSHDKASPISLTTYASAEGDENFSRNFTYNVQVMVSGRIGKRVYLFFSPAIHLKANGQRRFDPKSTDFFPPATMANSFHLPTNGASYGFGASVLITPTIEALFDFTPRTGFKLGRVTSVVDSSFAVTGFKVTSYPSIGFGIQKNIGRHAFALTFSNTQTTTTSRYNSSNLAFSPKKLVIGFNLSRRF